MTRDPLFNAVVQALERVEKFIVKAIDWIGDNIVDAIGGFLDNITTGLRNAGSPNGPGGGFLSMLNPANWLSKDSVSPSPTPAQEPKLGRSAEVMRTLETPAPDKSSISLPTRAMEMVSLSKATGGFGFTPVDMSSGELVSPISGVGAMNKFRSMGSGMTLAS